MAGSFFGPSQPSCLYLRRPLQETASRNYANKEAGSLSGLWLTSVRS